MEEEFEVLGEIEGHKEKKNLRTILNRGKLNKFELEDFMCVEDKTDLESDVDVE